MSTITFTDRQRQLARQALGLNYRMVSYRNRHFLYPGSVIHSVWLDMVAMGAAQRSDHPSGMDHFSLTHAGAEAALEWGESLCPEDFPPLAAEMANG